jgi:tRNA A-37 threonylcarbamoyl transferase component Bud32
VLGQRVNNFEIVRSLGEGGMGTVFEAEHRLIRRKVAVKVLKPELAVDSELVQRFFNEARATSAIRHPNIVEVIDVGRLAGGVPYLVMELLEGESLAERLERHGRLDIASAVEFVRQAASALVAAHGAGIVHRDLKPENLFLVPDQRFAERELVKVLDFGIAKLRADMTTAPVHTMAGAVFGTPPYMSPEQCRGLPDDIDERTDVYALGVILYEALCGRPPFESEAIGELMMLHMTVEPEPPSQLCRELSPQLEAVVLKALAKHRDDRFSSMAEFREALSATSAPERASHAAQGELAPVGAFGGATHSAPPGPIALPSGPSLAEARPLFALEAASTVLMPVEPRPSERLAQPNAARPPADARYTPAQRWLLAVAIGLPTLVGLFTLLRWPHSRAVFTPQATSVAAMRAAPRVLDTSVANAPPADDSAPLAPVATPQPTAAEKAGLGPPAARALAGSHVASREAAPRHTDRPSAKPPSPPRHEATPPSEVPNAAAPATTVDTPVTAPVEPGYLSLDSSPWSEVFLRGTPLGTTPIIRVPLPPGRHLLTLKNSELGTSTSYLVEIKSGKTVSRLVGWEK